MAEPLAALARLQRTARLRRTGTLVAVGAGLALASVHWLGLVAGGALVGLCQPSLRRALVGGFGFGAVVVLTFLARLTLAGHLGPALGGGPLLGVALVAPLVAGPFGAAVRGLQP